MSEIKLSEIERKALATLVDYSSEEYACFATIAADAEIDRTKIRRTVRSLARKGLAEYAKGLWTEDGTPAGSGYRSTNAGRAFIESSEVAS